MSLAVIASRTLHGLQAPAIRVEAHIASGLPAFQLVGLPDTEVRESRERVRAALASAGYAFPHGRVTVNLAPAGLPKASARFDLPIALGILLAAGLVALPELAQRRPGRPALADLVVIGELSLTGALVPVAGALAMARAVAHEQPGATLVMPRENATELSAVPGIQGLAVAHLPALIAHLEGHEPIAPVAYQPLATHGTAAPCLSEVRGQAGARRALEVAAAGAHNLLFYGPPGAGKSMLAQRLPGLLPPLTPDEALEAAALVSLQGQPLPAAVARPFRSPHHSASMAALIGGGSRAQPGEATLAHLGVLFLDELPEFPRSALEALREPLETGQIHLSRARHRIDYPARFQLIAAMNPCPCGWQGHPRRPCRCTPDQVVRYQSRLSGPWRDRIDLTLAVPPVDIHQLDAPAGEPSATVRERVTQARARQLARQGCANAQLDGSALATHAHISAEAGQLWRQAADHLGWSARAAQRALRVALTLADLAGADTIDASTMAEAIQYRRGP